MVCSKDFGALGEREYGWQPDAAPQLDGVSTRKGAFREVTGQREATRPEFGPVREPSSRSKSSSQIRSSAETGWVMRYVLLPTSTVDSASPVRPRRWARSLSRISQRRAGAASWDARSSRSAAARAAML